MRLFENNSEVAKLPNYDLERLSLLFGKNSILTRDQYFAIFFSKLKFTPIKGATYSFVNDANITALNLKNCDLGFIIFKSITFSDVTISDVTISDAGLQNIEFDSTDFRSFSLKECPMIFQCNFLHIKNSGYFSSGNNYINSNFMHVRAAKETNFKKNTFDGCGFYDVELHDKFFEINPDIKNCIFLDIGKVTASNAQKLANIFGRNELIIELQKFFDNPTTGSKINKDNLANALYVTKEDLSFIRDHKLKTLMDNISSQYSIFKDFHQTTNRLKSAFNETPITEISKFAYFYKNIIKPLHNPHSAEFAFLFETYGAEELSLALNQIFAAKLKDFDIDDQLENYVRIAELIQLPQFMEYIAPDNILFTKLAILLNHWRANIKFEFVFETKILSVLDDYNGIPLSDRKPINYINIKGFDPINNEQIQDLKLRNKFVLNLIIAAKGNVRELIEAELPTFFKFLIPEDIFEDVVMVPNPQLSSPNTTTNQAKISME